MIYTHSYYVDIRNIHVLLQKLKNVFFKKIMVLFIKEITLFYFVYFKYLMNRYLDQLAVDNTQNLNNIWSISNNNVHNIPFTFKCN